MKLTNKTDKGQKTKVTCLGLHKSLAVWRGHKALCSTSSNTHTDAYRETDRQTHTHACMQLKVKLFNFTNIFICKKKSVKCSRKYRSRYIREKINELNLVFRYSLKPQANHFSPFLSRTQRTGENTAKHIVHEDSCWPGEVPFLHLFPFIIMIVPTFTLKCVPFG